jgi:site-specific DNA recombinase
MARRAGIYLRISRAADGSTLGVERQLPDCEKLCRDKGWQVVDTYTDNDISAYRRKRRPDYERLLQDAVIGRIDAIVAWHPDRLSRDPDIDNVRLIDLADDYGTQLATAKAGDHDLSHAAGRMMFRQLGILARYESEHRAERNKLKHLEIARKGMPNGGMRPFGFEDDRATIKPDEKDLIKEAARRLLDGEKIHDIVQDWNRRQIPTTKGSTWQIRTLKRILLSARVIGQREHGGNVYPATWPAILEPETQAALRLLPTMNHPTPTQPVRKYVLTGLLVCGHPDCGGKVDGQTRINGKRSYECRHCFKLTRLADQVEKAVVDQALDVLDSPEVWKALIRGQDLGEKVEQARGQLRRDQDALDVLKASGILTEREHKKKTRQLQARAEAIAAKLPTPAARVLGLPYGDTVSGWWRKTPDLDKRREALSLAIEKVVLLPTTRGRHTFDPDAELDIHWQPVIPAELIAALVRKRDQE